MITLAHIADARWSAVTVAPNHHLVYRWGVEVGSVRLCRGLRRGRWIGERFGSRVEADTYRELVEAVAEGRASVAGPWSVGDEADE